MRYFTLTLAAASLAAAQTGISSSAAAIPTGQVVPVGQLCTVGGVPCALGATCYATNSGLQTVCGNLGAPCTSNQQCGFNTCQNGVCSGLASSTSPVTSPTPSPIGAVVQIGQPCTPGGTMCALGAQCYATNSMLQTVCGNFQAQCTSNQQCAFNQCQNGACGGPLLSSMSSSRPALTSPTVRPSVSSTMSSIRSINGTTTIQSRTPTLQSSIVSSTRLAGASTPVANASRSATSAPPAIFTGAAAVADVAGGVLAMVFGAFAFAL